MSTRKVFCVILSLFVFLGLSYVASAKSVSNAETAGQQAKEEAELTEWNNRIRREKFDLVLPEAMRKNHVDMWIHVMREPIPEAFGGQDDLFGDRTGIR